MGWGKRFKRSLKKAVKKTAGGVTKIAGELAGGVTGSESIQRYVQGGLDTALGAGMFAVTGGYLGGDYAKEGMSKIGQNLFTQEEQQILSAEPASLSPEQLRIRASLEARQRQLKGRGGRSGTLLTSARQDASQGGSRTILTSLSGQSSLLGR